MTTLNFHVRHEVTPDRCWDVLYAIEQKNDYEHITQFDRQLSRLRRLDLVSKDGISITEQGAQLIRLGAHKPDLIPELFHFLHLTRWRETNPLEDTMFFTYRAYCNLLYERREVALDDEREAIATELNQAISTVSAFADATSQMVKGAVSLSVNSLLGVEKWLLRLSPSVITNDQFQCRHFCLPEVLVLALGLMTEEQGGEWSIDQLLTEEKRAFLCKLCFLDEQALDAALDWSLPEYPDLAQEGTRIGSYGRFVRVWKMPSLEDLLI